MSDDAQPGLLRGGLSRLVGAVTPSVIDSVDIDAVIAEVDLDQLLERIDLDRLLARIDVNALIQRVDVNALLGDLELDPLLAKVDVNALAERAEIGRLVTESSQQVAGSALDLARRQMVGLDFVVTGLVNRLLRRREDLPLGPTTLLATAPAPDPGATRTVDEFASVLDRSADRLLVSGRYAGPVSRLAAFVVDSIVVTVAFTLITAVASFLVGLFASRSLHLGGTRGLWWTAGLVLWAFLYGVVSLVVAGRTLGKAVVGLRVVARAGTPLHPGAAVVRTMAQPLSFLMLGIGFVGLVVGRERRALHDVLAGTAVVYDWADRPAELPAPLTRFLMQKDASPDGPTSPGSPG